MQALDPFWNRDVYDAIVGGARCAGAPTAMLLARKGYNVLLVDRATFPSDTPHGHFIHRTDPRALHRWGLLNRLTASGCLAVTSSTLDFGDFPLSGTDLSIHGVAIGYGPRRRVLDQILLDSAAEAGAEMREGFTVDEFLLDDDTLPDEMLQLRALVRGNQDATNQLYKASESMIPPETFFNLESLYRLAAAAGMQRHV